MNSGKNIQTNKPHEIQAMGMGTRFKTNTSKPYNISRGKSPVFRKGMLYFVSAIFLTLISMTLFDFDSQNDPVWKEYILWSPRLISIVLVVVGALKLRQINEIKPFMQFKPEGISYYKDFYPWTNIIDVEIRQSALDDSYFAICIDVDGDKKEIDITNVDEFSEDVVVIFCRYLEKYKPVKPQDRT